MPVKRWCPTQEKKSDRRERKKRDRVKANRKARRLTTSHTPSTTKTVGPKTNPGTRNTTVLALSLLAFERSFRVAALQSWHLIMRQDMEVHETNGSTIWQEKRKRR